MASQTQGIQQLLAAEKKAAERVAEARKRKAKRLKQAKEEAQTEMERYRVEREKQFKQYEAMHMGTRTDIAAKIDGETKSKISGMAKSFQNNQEEVIQFLLTLAFDIKPELHTNAKLQAKLGEPAA